MKIHFTSGTYDYLKRLIEEHPNEELLFLQNEDAFLLVHETEGDSFFKEPRKYEVINSSGTFPDKGFAVFNHIPVSDEGRPLFEYQSKNYIGFIENEPGFMAIRVLRPLSSDTYVIFTLWENELAYKNWKTSNSFEKVYLNKDEKSIPKKQKYKLYPHPPFITKYSIVKDGGKENQS
jgi:heme oxygenase (mycobilin-producing)